MGAFLGDRKQMGEGARRVPPAHATARAQLPIFVARIEGMLGDQPYLTGTVPTIADLSAYHCFWFIRLSCPELLEPYQRLSAWMERIAAIGHGTSVALGSGEALEIARNSQHDARFIKPHTAADLQVDQAVRVRPADVGRDPSDGVLVFATDNELAIARHDERAGRVIVHFPRLGYDVIPA
jgi:glutathione S-transferase